MVFADEVWKVGEKGLGLMFSTAGVGGLLGAALVAKRGENTQRTRLMVVTAILGGLCVAIFSMLPTFYWALLPLFFANMCASASQTLNNTSVQLLVDNQVRGRVSSFMMMSYGITSIGVLPLAFVAQRIGPSKAVVVTATALIVLILLFTLLSPTLRKLDAMVAKKLNR